MNAKLRHAARHVTGAVAIGLPVAGRSMERLGTLRRGHKAIARHDRKELRAVWWPISRDDIGDVTEILRANIRSQDDEGASVLLVRIAESVHRASGCIHPCGNRHFEYLHTGMGNSVNQIPDFKLSNLDYLRLTEVLGTFSLADRL